MEKVIQSKADIFIYTKDGCSFCNRAINEIEKLGCKYDTCNISEDLEMANTIKIENNFNTFPQIYIKTKFIGGYDSLLTYLMTNKIHSMLNISIDF